MALDEVVRLYESIGYAVIVTSTRTEEGIADARSKLTGRISVFSGQSGVGKSSLLNALVPGLALETNEISSKLGRGKHTTRHVELIALEGNGGGLVADTPGFSQLDFLQMEAEELSSCFVEMKRASSGCKFRGCLHQHEPGCRVLTLVANGEIAASRYKHYLVFLQEMKERKRRY
jgi:ribosome biogenesis GTPase